MAGMSPEERSRIGRLGALGLHAGPHGREAAAKASAASRTKQEARWIAEIDPESTLSPEELARRLGFKRRQYFVNLSRLAWRSRRAKANAKAGVTASR